MSDAKWVRGVLAASLFGVVASLACTQSKTEAAEATVRRFFEALPAGDCAVLGPLLAEASSAEDCREKVEVMKAHRFALVEVLGAEVDGRTPDAVVVRARLSRDGQVREEPYLIRVERHPDGWKMRF